MFSAVFHVLTENKNSMMGKQEVKIYGKGSSDCKAGGGF